MSNALPGMVAAMANAYAPPPRRFTTSIRCTNCRPFSKRQPAEPIPEASYTIMANPDIAARQQSLMSQSMSRAQGDIASSRRSRRRSSF
ncbi:hypothetical protein FPZ24_00025 [Sphingomonas panacisoli]|uniref:Uncharacterized protein n=1 Tax=Sphingomonas panacisoli TaxID=1813879 RepID=A0A5B8LFW5_9SPHN|nr:hypothetical protein [Sphingomonas panacisoli]QDZ06060.1 hypothetical protein FPZ24_00025 [Sphingomonas panacisoli]